VNGSLAIAPARVRWAARCAVVLVALAALHPVLANGFLNVAFDDPGFVTEVDTIGPWSWQRLWMCFDRPYLHDYVPLPMVSYLLDYQLWSLDPRGYHLTNLLLHIVAALLVLQWVETTLKSTAAGLWAGLVFAVHPVQVEAVAIVAQRKTLLSTVFLLLALLAYQRFTLQKRAVWNGFGIAAFAAACVSKSSVVPFPVLLLLYDWFTGKPVNLRNKLPYFAIAIATAGASVALKTVDVIKAAHADSALATALVMSRVWWEYLVSLFLPTSLSPAYYYQRATLYQPLHYAALLGFCAGVWALWRNRRRIPTTAFWIAWMLVALLPVANLVPIAVVRADRYLYLPMVAFALWVGAGLARLRTASAGSQRAAWLVGALWCAWLARESHAYTAVFRDDVSARGYVVERYPWAAPAHYLLALAWIENGEWLRAQASAQAALALDPQFHRARDLLGELEQRLTHPPSAEE